jgi:hypothetical protein
VAVAPEAEEELIGTKFDVIAHHVQVHPDQLDRESIDNEFHFNFNCAAYDLGDARSWELIVNKFRVEEARKVTVHPFAFVATDQLVAKA